MRNYGLLETAKCKNLTTRSNQILSESCNARVIKSENRIKYEQILCKKNRERSNLDLLLRLCTPVLQRETPSSFTEIVQLVEVINVMCIKVHSSYLGRRIRISSGSNEFSPWESPLI